MIGLSRNERHNGKIFVIRRGDELIRVVARAGPDIYASALPTVVAHLLQRFGQPAAFLLVQPRTESGWPGCCESVDLEQPLEVRVVTVQRCRFLPLGLLAQNPPDVGRRTGLFVRFPRFGAVPSLLFEPRNQQMFRLLSFVSARAASSSVPIAVSHSSCALSAAPPWYPVSFSQALDVVGEVVAGTRRVACPVDQAASQRLLHPRHGQVRAVAARRRGRLQCLQRFEQLQPRPVVGRFGQQELDHAVLYRPDDLLAGVWRSGDLEKARMVRTVES